VSGKERGAEKGTTIALGRYLALIANPAQNFCTLTARDNHHSRGSQVNYYWYKFHKN
jgi:hypothetical protein